MKPDFCPECLKKNVVATTNGPTCSHVEQSGAAWWPTGWELDSTRPGAMTQGQRIEWLQAKRSLQLKK